MGVTGYIKLSNDFWRNTKIRKLAIQGKWQAIALFMFALSYCGDSLTDGRITKDDLLYQLSGDEESIKTLVDSHLLEAIDGAYIIHDYLAWQRSKDDIVAANLKHAERQKNYRKRNSDTSPHRHPTVTQASPHRHASVSDAAVTEKPRTQNPEPKITKRECREKNTNQETSQPHSQAPSLKDWEEKLLKWHHGDEHRRMVDRFAQEGKPKVDLDALETEFKASIASKGNSQGYVDFDEAFKVWILKRTESLWKKALPDIPAISSKSHGSTIIAGPSEADWNAHWNQYLADHPGTATGDYLKERRRFFAQEPPE